MKESALIWIIIGAFGLGLIIGQWILYKYLDYRESKMWFKKFHQRKKEWDEEYKKNLIKAIDASVPIAIGYLKDRDKKKNEFVIKHKDLCEKAFTHGNGHKDYKSNEGRELVKLAREYIGYSDSTYSGDIYSIIYGVFNDKFKCNSVNS